MPDVYTRFRNEGDYYDITGTQPPTSFAQVPAAPAQTVAVQQGGGVPVTRRVLNIGRNDYNMPGSLEAAQAYGISPVMVQSSPYARTAYSYGPSGPIPLIGATSVYPHVVSSGDYDYAAPYRRTVVPVGGSLNDIMAHIERMARFMRPRGGGGTGGTGGGSSTAKKDTTQKPLPPEPPMFIMHGGQNATSPVQRTDNRGLKLSSPDDPFDQEPATPSSNVRTIQAYRANDPNNPFRKQGSVGVPDIDGMVPAHPTEVVPAPVPTMPAHGTDVTPYSPPAAPPVYETIPVDPSDWNLDYADTLNSLLDLLGESSARPNFTPSPDYTGPAILRIPQNAW